MATARSLSRKRRKRRRRRRKTPRAERVVAVGLGANIDGPERRLSRAIDALGEVLGELRVSPLFRTTPISPLPQPPFWNAALTGVSDLGAEELLAVAKALEWAHGRRRGARFGPRVLDIDLLVHGDTVLTSPELTVPHPRLPERRFYLEPLARIAPQLEVPPGPATVSDLLARAPTDQRVMEVPWNPPPTALWDGRLRG